MAQNRQISTNYWKDNYVVELDPTEKLVFLYLLTNPRTNVAGLYEINLREVAFDTGFDIEVTKRIIAKFEKDGKVQYVGGYLLLKNWVKHQSTNPSISAGIDRIIEQLPAWLNQMVERDAKTGNLHLSEQAVSQPVEPETQPGDSLSTGRSTLLNLTLLNSTLPNGKADDTVAAPPKKKRVMAPPVKTEAINALFDEWEETVGYRITAQVPTNREYAAKLIREYKREELTGMLRGVALSQADQYAPRVANFSDLYRKWDALKGWGRRTQAKSQGKSVTI